MASQDTASKAIGIMRKVAEVLSASATWFFTEGRLGELASCSRFLVWSVLETGIWGWVALETQLAESFLSSLVLSPISRVLLSFGHHLFVISAMIKLQTNLSDGPVGLCLRALLQHVSGKNQDRDDS